MTRPRSACFSEYTILGYIMVLLEDWRKDGIWSKISNALKRLGFRYRNFLAQLLSETSKACTIRVRRLGLGRLWNDLGAHAGLRHWNGQSGTPVAERVSGGREPDPLEVRSRVGCCFRNVTRRHWPRLLTGWDAELWNIWQQRRILIRLLAGVVSSKFRVHLNQQHG